jgi:hypothetical protein
MPGRTIHDLTTAEAHQLLAEQLGREVPPLEAVENEDWGRDYLLQELARLPAEELARLGLSLEAEEG